MTNHTKASTSLSERSILEGPPINRRRSCTPESETSPTRDPLQEECCRQEQEYETRWLAARGAESTTRRDVVRFLGNSSS